MSDDTNIELFGLKTKTKIDVQKVKVECEMQNVDLLEKNSIMSDELKTVKDELQHIQVNNQSLNIEIQNLIKNNNHNYESLQFSYNELQSAMTSVVQQKSDLSSSNVSLKETIENQTSIIDSFKNEKSCKDSEMEKLTNDLLEVSNSKNKVDVLLSKYENTENDNIKNVKELVESQTKLVSDISVQQDLLTKSNIELELSKNLILEFEDSLSENKKMIEQCSQENDLLKTENSSLNSKIDILKSEYQNIETNSLNDRKNYIECQKKLEEEIIVEKSLLENANGEIENSKKLILDFEYLSSENLKTIEQFTLQNKDLESEVLSLNVKIDSLKCEHKNIENSSLSQIKAYIESQKLLENEILFEKSLNEKSNNELDKSKKLISDFEYSLSENQTIIDQFTNECNNLKNVYIENMKLVTNESELKEQNKKISSELEKLCTDLNKYQMVLGEQTEEINFFKNDKENDNLIIINLKNEVEEKKIIEIKYRELFDESKNNEILVNDIGKLTTRCNDLQSENIVLNQLITEREMLIENLEKNMSSLSKRKQHEFEELENCKRMKIECVDFLTQTDNLSPSTDSQFTQTQTHAVVTTGVQHVGMPLEDKSAQTPIAKLATAGSQSDSLVRASIASQSDALILADIASQSEVLSVASAASQSDAPRFPEVEAAREFSDRLESVEREVLFERSAVSAFLERLQPSRIDETVAPSLDALYEQLRSDQQICQARLLAANCEVYLETSTRPI